MTINLMRGRRFIDCGCGGATQPLSIGLVVRNVVLAIAAMIALVPAPTRPLGWLDIVSMVAGVLVLGSAVCGDESIARGACTSRRVGVMDALIVSNIVLWMLVIGLAFVVFALTRQIGVLARTRLARRRVDVVGRRQIRRNAAGAVVDDARRTAC